MCCRSSQPSTSRHSWRTRPACISSRSGSAADAHRPQGESQRHRRVRPCARPAARPASRMAVAAYTREREAHAAGAHDDVLRVAEAHDGVGAEHGQRHQQQPARAGRRSRRASAPTRSARRESTRPVATTEAATLIHSHAGHPSPAADALRRVPDPAARFGEQHGHERRDDVGDVEGQRIRSEPGDELRPARACGTRSPTRARSATAYRRRARRSGTTT